MHPKLTLLRVLAVAMVAFTASCKKDNVPPGATKHSDASGTYLNEKNSWYLTREGSGGTVHVRFNGNTNADSVKIITSGDGLQTAIPVILSSDKSFNEDVPVSFSVAGVQSGIFTTSTILKAYKGKDVLTVTLQSGKLSY